MRRTVSVLMAMAVMAAMLALLALPALAGPNKASSCGRAVSEVRTDVDEFNDCGILINPNYVPGGTFPPGGGLYT